MCFRVKQPPLKIINYTWLITYVQSFLKFMSDINKQHYLKVYCQRQKFDSSSRDAPSSNTSTSSNNPFSILLTGAGLVSISICSSAGLW